MVLSFVQAAISARLDAPVVAGPVGTVPKPAGGFARVNTKAQALKKIDVKAGWLGDMATYDFSPYATYEGDKSKATWLPDESMAKAWQRYLRAE